LVWIFLHQAWFAAAMRLKRDGFALIPKPFGAGVFVLALECLCERLIKPATGIFARSNRKTCVDFPIISGYKISNPFFAFNQNRQGGVCTRPTVVL
jgi:hypothetical protein